MKKEMHLQSIFAHKKSSEIAKSSIEENFPPISYPQNFGQKLDISTAKQNNHFWLNSHCCAV